MSWKETIVGFFDVFGPASLAMVSFTESIIQPIPPDLIYIPMLADTIGDVPMVIWLWLTVTLSSVAGSMVGYWIGKRWGRNLLGRFAKQSHLDKIEALTLKYGTLGIFIAAFSPIPYKVFGWVAGMGPSLCRGRKLSSAFSMSLDLQVLQWSLLLNRLFSQFLQT